MGNHSETGELLGEALEAYLTEGIVLTKSSHVDADDNLCEINHGHTKDTHKNPTKLKDSSGRDVDMLRNELYDVMLTPKQVEAMEAKRNKKKDS